MAVYYTPLPWSGWLTRSLLSCFGQMSLLQMAYCDLCVRPNDEVRPQAIAILWAIIAAGRDGLRWVVCLRCELVTHPGRHPRDTLLGWADSAGLDTHMLFSRAIAAAWRDLQNLCGMDLFPYDRPPSPHTPPGPPPGTGKGTGGDFWV